MHRLRAMRHTIDKLTQLSISKALPNVSFLLMKTRTIAKGDGKNYSTSGSWDCMGMQNKNKDLTKTDNHEKTKSSDIEEKQRKRSKLPEMAFEKYMSEEECNEGLRTSQLYAGALKINVRRFQNAYIEVEGYGKINIKGVRMRNRALPGDIVAVKLLPYDNQTEDTNSEGEGEEELYSNTGKVVRIMQKKHSRITAGYLRPFYGHKLGFALMKPIDRRLPLLMIPLRECPIDFIFRPIDYKNTIYVAKISSWGLNMEFASGMLIRNLGEAGHIEPETEAILIKNQVDTSEFKEDVIKCLPNSDTWEVTQEELAKRKDLRNECIFTIDPSTARDLDDAVSCKKITEDMYEVGVHIADVSHFIDEGSALDKVAKSRATSVYLPHRVIPMLPRILCEDLCSLNTGVERLAYSVIWNIKSDGTIVSEWFGRSVIRSCMQLSYDHAQMIIENQDNELVVEDYPPITGNFSLSKISAIVKNLYDLSVNLRTKRLASGAISMHNPKISFTFDSETGVPNGCRVDEYTSSKGLIEEFMLLANITVGKKIFQSYPKKAILRRHPPPNNKLVIETSEMDTPEVDPEFRRLVNELMFFFTLERALYFCAGSIDDVTLYHHYGLNVPIYTHFTSPIRRYADVLVHRLLTASLDKKVTVIEGTKKLQEIASHCNVKKHAAKMTSDETSLLFFAAFVKLCGPLTDKGVVFRISRKKIDVLSIRLGLVNEVFYDRMSLRKHDYDRKGDRVTLYWEDCSNTRNETRHEDLDANNNEIGNGLANYIASTSEKIKQSKEIKPSVRDEETDDIGLITQDLAIFSPVDITYSVESNAPTTILATLINPHDITAHSEHGL